MYWNILIRIAVGPCSKKNVLSSKVQEWNVAQHSQPVCTTDSIEKISLECLYGARIKIRIEKKKKRKVTNNIIRRNKRIIVNMKMNLNNILKTYVLIIDYIED